jgi:alpha-glucosidase/alpha-D-xyloside xylohydrolase
MNNPAIEPVIKQYAQLRYQLLSYTYGLANEAFNNGLPLMRALWLHYPNDSLSVKTADQFLWGTDLLIAPVYQKGATERKLYLPPGEWYDWWSNEKKQGGQLITREVDLALMPIYVKAGAILPIDPIRQFTSEQTDEPLMIRIYPGKDGAYTLYEDDGTSIKYMEGGYELTRFTWNDKRKTLTIADPQNKMKAGAKKRNFSIVLMPGKRVKNISYTGETQQVSF